MVYIFSITGATGNYHEIVHDSLRPGNQAPKAIPLAPLPTYTALSETEKLSIFSSFLSFFSL